MSSAFRVVSRKDLGAAAWDAFVDASDNAWLWHRYDLQEAHNTWRGSADESFVVMAPTGDAVLALVPLRRVTRRAAGLWPVNVLDSFGGPALVNGQTRRQSRDILTAVRHEIGGRAAGGLCLEARLSMHAMAPALRGESCPRVNPLLGMGCDNTLTQTWVVDLRGGRDALWSAMEGRARTAIRKAEKAGVTVRAAGARDLDIYYRLHRDTYRRTGAEPLPEAYFRMIWERFVAKGLARVWIAEIDGEPLAAENFGIYKKAAIYWSGASSERGLETEANSLLQWTAMEWMLNNAVAWYEAGEAFPSFDAGKQKGLNDFKKSFGGELYPYYKGRLPSQTVWQKLYRGLAEVRR
jgi:hypothetical protein